MQEQLTKKFQKNHSELGQKKPRINEMFFQLNILLIQMKIWLKNLNNTLETVNFRIS